MHFHIDIVSTLEQSSNILCLSLTDLEDQPAPGLQPPRCLIDEPTDDVETVWACEQGLVGLVLDDVARQQFPFGCCDIRRVRDDDVH
jgi:hypothetical protein